MCKRKTNLERKSRSFWKKRIQASDKKLIIIEVGSYVLVNIKKVDRGPLDPKNIIGKVIDKKK